MPESIFGLDPDELPEPTGDRVFLARFVMASLKAMPPKQGRKALRELEAMFASDESMATVRVLRTNPKEEAVRAAQREARVIWTMYRGAFKACVDGD